jgi:uncharacterized protein YegJ (DUF2314 family)
VKLAFLLLSLVLLAGCSKPPETLVTGGYDEQAMDAAIARARQETDEFLKVLESGQADSFCVKAPISDNHGTEHFWISDVTFKDGVFYGKIADEPGVVNNVKFGQDWSLKREDISDWMYVRGERIYGGYTIDPLLSTISKAKAKELKRRLVR